MRAQPILHAPVLMLTPAPRVSAATPAHVVARVAWFQARDVMRSRWLVNSRGNVRVEPSSKAAPKPCLSLTKHSTLWCPQMSSVV